MSGKRARRKEQGLSYRPKYLWAARARAGAKLPLFLIPDTVKRTKVECRLALRATYFWSDPNGNLAVKLALAKNGYLEIVRVSVTPVDVVDKTMSALWGGTIDEFRERFVERHRQEIAEIFHKNGWPL